MDTRHLQRSRCPRHQRFSEINFSSDSDTDDDDDYIPSDRSSSSDSDVDSDVLSDPSAKLSESSNASLPDYFDRFSTLPTSSHQIAERRQRTHGYPRIWSSYLCLPLCILTTLVCVLGILFCVHRSISPDPTSNWPWITPSPSFKNGTQFFFEVVQDIEDLVLLATDPIVNSPHDLMLAALRIRWAGQYRIGSAMPSLAHIACVNNKAEHSAKFQAIPFETVEDSWSETNHLGCMLEPVVAQCLSDLVKNTYSLKVEWQRIQYDHISEERNSQLSIITAAREFLQDTRRVYTVYEEAVEADDPTDYDSQWLFDRGMRTLVLRYYLSTGLRSTDHLHRSVFWEEEPGGASISLLGDYDLAVRTMIETLDLSIVNFDRFGGRILSVLKQYAKHPGPEAEAAGWPQADEKTFRRLGWLFPDAHRLLVDSWWSYVDTAMREVFLNSTLREELSETRQYLVALHERIRIAITAWTKITAEWRQLFDTSFTVEIAKSPQPGDLPLPCMEGTVCFPPKAVADERLARLEAVLFYRRQQVQSAAHRFDHYRKYARSRDWGILALHFEDKEIAEACGDRRDTAITLTVVPKPEDYLTRSDGGYFGPTETSFVTIQCSQTVRKLYPTTLPYTH